MEKTNAWALELERKGKDEQREKKAWVKEKSSYLFIEAVETVCLPTCLGKLACSPSATIGCAVRLPVPVLMRIV